MPYPVSNKACMRTPLFLVMVQNIIFAPAKGIYYIFLDEIVS